MLTALPNLPGGNNANPFWINNLGQVSGVAESDIADPSCSIGPNGPSEPNGLNGPDLKRLFLPLIWEPKGEIRKLSPLASKGDTVAHAFTINDHGEAVGTSGLCSTAGLPPFALNFSTASHAVLWDKDGVHDLGSLGGAINGASSINNLGEVVGVAQSPTDGTVHAFLWTRQAGMLVAHMRRVSPSRSNQRPERGLYMAGFQVIIYGRFWVFTEECIGFPAIPRQCGVLDKT